MLNFRELSKSEQWQTLVGFGRKALGDQGYTLKREPGRGRQNIWTAQRDGKQIRISIRTTMNRWIAYPPLGNGRWKTLSNVEKVLIVAVDDKDFPKKAEVYLLSAAKVNVHFDEAFKARDEAGRALPKKRDFGMWVALDRRSTGGVNDSGSGIVEGEKPIAVFSLDEGVPVVAERPVSSLPIAETRETVQTILVQTRERIAMLTGVPVDQIKLDLHIGA